MLKVLPSYISNLIAAGEVVQRPASVVKELVENAIDAGAVNISININDAGRTLIQVIDDGCGMTCEEGKLSFERHATSKISEAEDLQSIITYGFRGEALASIAAVAEVTMRTRKRNEDTGSQIVFAESKFLSQEFISCPEGTNIAVRNIFYNVPARRKFLKSENSELRQIISEFCRVAICHPETGLKLVHNKKDLYNLKPVQNLKQRIIEVAGKEINKELVDIKADTSIVNISGFIGKPEDARKTAGNQYFFVNGRFFKSPYLHKAIMKAYDKLLPDGYTPSYFIFFETDPKTIDINIHPAKIEVKFEDESAVFEILNAAARASLGMNSFGPSIDFDTEGAPEIPIPLRKGAYVPPPKINYDPLFNPFNNSTTDVLPDRQESSVEGYGKLFEEQGASRRNIILLHGKYVVTTVKSGMLIINIARARERILYERFLKNLDDCTPVAQETLFPQTIELDTISYSILMENPERLRMFGFDITSLADDAIVVNGLPDGYPTDSSSVKKSIDNLIAILSDTPSEAFQKAEGRNNMAIALAKAGSLGITSQMDEIEAQLLVDSLFACMEPDITPDGRPCMTIMTIEEIERKL